MSKKSHARRKPIAPPPKEFPRKANARHSVPAPPPYHHAMRQEATTPASRTFGAETPPFLLKSNARFKFLDINNLNSSAGHQGR